MLLDRDNVATADVTVDGEAVSAIDLGVGGPRCFYANIGDHTDMLGPRESTAVLSAVGKRRREFSTGRMLAALQLKQLGIDVDDIPVGSRGQPVWPNGVVGSIAHTDQLAAVTLGSASSLAAIGIDLEIENRLEPELVRLVLSKRERERYRHLDKTLVFSAKEACYKLLNPLTGSFIEFLDIEIDICETNLSFTARYLGSTPANAVIEEATGYFGFVSGHCLAAIGLPPVQ